MRRLLAALVVVATASIPALAQDKPAEGDAKKLEGKWTAKAGPDATPVELTFSAKGDVSIKVVAPTGEEMTLEGKFSVVETASPKTMDWESMKVRTRELPPLQAIYAFDGDDMLKVAGMGGSKRPTEFIEKGKELPGVRPNTMIFTREKKPAN